MYKILSLLSCFIIGLISAMGYLGIVLAMAIESACIPLPSEVIMPFSGYLVAQGRFRLGWVSLAGALGCSIGSVLAYGVGIWGGRPLVLKYGKYVLIHRKDLERADRFFEKYGDKATFLARLLPVIRTFISLPAGISRMDFSKFLFYSFAGSLPWCFFLAWIGFKLGERWDEVHVIFQKLDLVIGAVLVAAIAWFLWSHWKKNHGNGADREESVLW
ncbi:MAG: DedA family protein [candidate division NC10 bacterium]|nr:DedA family protein [candidate division NC10 bacterium]